MEKGEEELSSPVMDALGAPVFGCRGWPATNISFTKFMPRTARSLEMETVKAFPYRTTPALQKAVQLVGHIEPIKQLTNIALYPTWMGRITGIGQRCSESKLSLRRIHHI